MNKPLLFLFFFISVSFASLKAQDSDDAQTFLRLNPEIENETEVSVNYSDYPFLNLDANHIQLNGADWSSVNRAVLDSRLGNGITSVVHLGDSHIQADFAGAVLRQRLGGELGEAGRGLIIPFKAAGTNEPFDYTFVINGSYSSSKLLKQPWATIMPFSGVGIEPAAVEFTVDISCHSEFDRMTFFYEGDGTLELVSADSEGENQIFGAATTDEGVYEVAFRQLIESVKLHLRRNGSVILAGVSLSSDISGAYFHSVGNNGATFSSYNSIPGFGREFAVLEPDLVIISLGTNEAFGKIDVDNILYNIDELINTIRAHSPSVQILLTTPSECFRRTVTRNKRRRVSSFKENTNVCTVRDLILKYATEHGVAVYDAYSVLGSASNLKNAQLLSRDGVHFTATGYRLLGNLLADALLETIIED